MKRRAPYECDPFAVDPQDGFTEFLGPMLLGRSTSKALTVFRKKDLSSFQSPPYHMPLSTRRDVSTRGSNPSITNRHKLMPRSVLQFRTAARAGILVPVRHGPSADAGCSRPSRYLSLSGFPTHALASLHLGRQNRRLATSTRLLRRLHCSLNPDVAQLSRISRAGR